jgi:hypothetical protein
MGEWRKIREEAKRGEIEKCATRRRSRMSE